MYVYANLAANQNEIAEKECFDQWLTIEPVLQDNNNLFGFITIFLTWKTKRIIQSIFYYIASWNDMNPHVQQQPNGYWWRNKY